MFFVKFAAVNSITMKRRRLARLLLCIFLPMLLLASVHEHGQVADASMDCYQCLHHIHHGGHLTTEAFSMANCLLCQLLSTPFEPSSAVVVPAMAALLVAVVATVVAAVVAGRRGTACLRAPPVCL